MKVLFVCDQPQVPGGVQFVCRQIVSAVQTLGCDVAVLRPEPKATERDYVDIGQRYPLNTSFNGGIKKSLRMALDSFAPDVVHLVSVRLPVARQVDLTVTGIPWVLGIHNLPPHEAALPHWHGNDRLYYYLRNTRFAPNALMWAVGLKTWGYARLICHSSQVLDCITRYKGDSSRTIEVPLGSADRVSPSVAAPDRCPHFPAGKSPRLLTIAGIVHHKGLHDYLRAVAALTDVLPDFHYLIIGGERDSTYARYLEKLARKLRISSRLSLVYDATDVLIDGALKCADLYIQPSHEEGFGLAFLDAALVVPRLLGTNVGEMPRISQGDSQCEVVRAGDIKSLRDGTVRLLARPQCQDVVSRRYKRLMRQYSWTKAAGQMVQLYDELSRDQASTRRPARPCSIQVNSSAL